MAGGGAREGGGGGAIDPPGSRVHVRKMAHDASGQAFPGGTSPKPPSCHASHVDTMITPPPPPPT